MDETRETRLKRLHMRSIRRGIKEMDLILTAFATTRLRDLPVDKLDLYEQLLEENDQDLLSWITGQGQAPDSYNALWPEIEAAAASLGSSDPA